MSRLRHAEDLVWEWDPIGLKHVRDDVPGEYDGLARILDSMLLAGRHPAAIVERLSGELRANWGIFSVPADLEDRIGNLARLDYRSEDRGV